MTSLQFCVARFTRPASDTPFSSYGYQINRCRLVTLIIRVTFCPARSLLAEGRPGPQKSKRTTGMKELRDLVIDTHGGIERWNKVTIIEADMSITGALWTRKGW